MSYCRFSSGDVYLYAHVGGGFECCACWLADPIKSIFTVGCKDNPFFGDIEPCEDCNGKGCDSCTMQDSIRLQTRTECLEHLQKHRDAGHQVPEYAFEALRKELKEEGEENEPYFDDGYDGPVLIDFRGGTVEKLEKGLQKLDREKEEEDESRD